MKKVFLTSLIITMFCSACSSDSSSGSGGEISLERSNFLVNISDNFIIPQFEAFLSDTEALVDAKNIFIENPNEANLVSLRTNLTTAYTSFQPVGAYAELGLAGELNYYLNLNAHALDVEETLTNIETFNTVDLSIVSEQDEQGLPAVDYLVNGLGNTDIDILAFYTGVEAANYTGYLSLVVDRIENLTQQVLDNWNGGFRDEFVANTSSSSSGSFDILINAYAEFFEARIRRSKVDNPIGFISGTPFPEEIESLYNPIISRSLLLEALENAENIYIGIDNSEVSLSTIVINADGGELDTELKSFFDAAETQITNDINDNLFQQIEDDRSSLVATRDALQRIVALLKSDLTSILGVDIAFADNDGD